MVEIMGATLGIRIACLKDYCRKNRYPVAVEIHCNKMPNKPLQRGFFCMAWYQSKEALEMSRYIIRELRLLRPDAKCRGINRVSHSQRWVGTGMEYETKPKPKPVGFLENTPCPAVIVEAGYLSNPIDASWLRDRENRFAFGESVGRGILNYLEDKNGQVSKS
jgi:N-acetylmuramoyl-L-alanine amidase